MLFIVTLAVAATAQAPYNNFKFEPSYKSMFLIEHQNNIIPKDASAQLQSKFTPSYQRNYTVTDYNIFLDWYNVLKFSNLNQPYYKFDAENIISLNIDSNNSNKITLDADTDSLIIKSVTLIPDNKALTFSIKSDSMTISLNKTYQKATGLKISIKYQYNRKKFTGILSAPKGYVDGRGAVTPENLIYTMNEPDMAFTWLPCDQSSNKKQTMTMNVRVPWGFTAIANGLRQSVFSDDTSSIFQWRTDIPICLYLINATATKFDTYSHWYHKVTNPSETVEVQYYFWHNDLDSSTNSDGYHARNVYKNVTKYMEFLASKFGEYPFEKYGLVAISPFFYGGMENQTITMLYRDYLRNYNEGVVVHETAHQWIGDLTTCETWNDIWFNEGGADWVTTLWDEYDKGKSASVADFQNFKNHYLSYQAFSNAPIYGVDKNDAFGNYAVIIYEKGAWVYHMLRHYCGDTLFINAMKDLFQTYRYTTINTEQFKTFMKSKIKSPLMNLDTFFTQWLYSAGHAQYIVYQNTNNFQKDSLFNIRLVQTQSMMNAPPLFVNPIKIDFYKNGKISRSDTILNNKKDQSFALKIPFMPDSALIDQDFVLCEVLQVISSITDNGSGSPLKIYPSPLSSNSNLYICFDTAELPQSVEIIDSFGSKIFSTDNVNSGMLILAPALFPNAGIYFVRLNYIYKSKLEKISVFN